MYDVMKTKKKKSSGLVRGVLIGAAFGSLITAYAMPRPAEPEYYDKHEAMKDAISFSIEGYQLDAPKPMDSKPLKVGDLGAY